MIMYLSTSDFPDVVAFPAAIWPQQLSYSYIYGKGPGEEGREVNDKLISDRIVSFLIKLVLLSKLQYYYYYYF